MVRFKSHTIHLLSALVGLALLSVVVFAARNWNASPATVGMIGSSPSPSGTTTVTSTSLPKTWGFTLDLPSGWLVTEAKDPERSERARVDGWIASGVPTEAFGADLNVLTIQVTDVVKDGRSFPAIAEDYIWTDADVREIVSFMREEAADLFPDFSEADVRIASAADSVGGFAAVRATKQCLKPCYIEGGAATTVRYIVNAPDLVYLFDVSVGTSTKTAELLNQADAVIRTFKAK